MSSASGAVRVLHRYVSFFLVFCFLVSSLFLPCYVFDFESSHLFLRFSASPSLLSRLVSLFCPFHVEVQTLLFFAAAHGSGRKRRPEERRQPETSRVSVPPSFLSSFSAPFLPSSPPSFSCTSRRTHRNSILQKNHIKTPPFSNQRISTFGDAVVSIGIPSFPSSPFFFFVSQTTQKLRDRKQRQGARRSSATFPNTINHSATGYRHKKITKTEFTAKQKPSSYAHYPPKTEPRDRRCLTSSAFVFSSSARSFSSSARRSPLLMSSKDNDSPLETDDDEEELDTLQKESRAPARGTRVQHDGWEEEEEESRRRRDRQLERLTGTPPSPSASGLMNTQEAISPPPDLASMLLHNRVLYMGLPLSASVVELLVSQLLYLHYESRSRPVYMYINSSGSETPDRMPTAAFESEVLAIADVMRYVTCPIYTIGVGHVWGTAALLLSVGSRGYRFCLPRCSILLRQSMVPGRASGSVSDVVIRSREAVEEQARICRLLSQTTGRKAEEVQEAFKVGRYFSPTEAVAFGLIDQVLTSERHNGKLLLPSFIAAMRERGESALQKIYPHPTSSSPPRSEPSALKLFRERS